MTRWISIFVGLVFWLSAGGATAIDINVPGDHPTIQEAIDAAVAGDRILVESGTYVGDVVIRNRKKLELIGLDRPVIEGGFGRSPALRIASSSRITVSGIDFRGGNGSSALVRISNSKRVKLRDAAIGPSDEEGLELEDTNKVSVSNVLVHDSRTPCVRLSGKSKKTVLKKSALRDCGSSGIIVTDNARGFEIIKNKIRRTGENGISVFWGSENPVVIKGNIVSDIPNRCIDVVNESRVVDNVTKDCGFRGFTAYGDDNLFRGNIDKRSPCGFRDFGSGNRFEGNDWRTCD